MKNSLFCLAILIFLLNSCNGAKDDCPGGLQFYLPVQAYGIKDTLQLGDSLHIRLDIPDKLTESNSSNVYDFINYEFRLITYLEMIDTIPIAIDSKENGNWSTLIGESKYSNGHFLVFPFYSDHVYHYEVKIKPKKRGLFVFGMNSVADRASPLENLAGPCSRRPVQVYMKLENDTNTNFEFLKFSPEPAYINLDRKRFDDFAGFCFFVK